MYQVNSWVVSTFGYLSKTATNICVQVFVAICFHFSGIYTVNQFNASRNLGCGEGDSSANSSAVIQRGWEAALGPGDPGGGGLWLDSSARLCASLPCSPAGPVCFGNLAGSPAPGSDSWVHMQMRTPNLRTLIGQNAALMGR